jgi:hypothetical protein
MWRSRQWALLLNILDHLPRTSAYAQAMATDEELADALAELPQPDRKPSWSRSHRDFTPEVEMLSALFDRLGELVRVTAAMRGARPGAPSLAPRPPYALERARKARLHAQHDQLVSRLIKKPAG